MIALLLALALPSYGQQVAPDVDRITIETLYDLNNEPQFTQVILWESAKLPVGSRWVVTDWRIVSRRDAPRYSVHQVEGRYVVRFYCEGLQHQFRTTSFQRLNSYVDSELENRKLVPEHSRQPRIAAPWR